MELDTRLSKDQLHTQSKHQKKLCQCQLRKPQLDDSFVDRHVAPKCIIAFLRHMRLISLNILNEFKIVVASSLFVSCPAPSSGCSAGLRPQNCATNGTMGSTLTLRLYASRISPCDILVVLENRLRLTAKRLTANGT